MDHEMVMSLYPTLFWSSKDNSNDHLGCFGLGSKAPFSYTTEFTVTCWLDGRRRTYTCVIGHDGKPKVILMENEECADEPTGLMVSFPVKQDDIQSFQQHIQEIAQPYRPVFKANITVESAQIAEETPHFYAIRHMNEGPFAQIGPVWYRIDTKHEGLVGSARRRPRRDPEKHLQGLGVQDADRGPLGGRRISRSFEIIM